MPYDPILGAYKKKSSVDCLNSIFTKFSDSVHTKENLFYHRLISSNSLDKPEKSLLHLGHSDNYNTEQWLDFELSRTHINIFENKPTLNSYDVYFAKQAIQNKLPLVFSTYSKESMVNVMQEAQKSGRKFYFLNTTKENFDILEPLVFHLDFEIIGKFWTNFLISLMEEELKNQDGSEEEIETALLDFKEKLEEEHIQNLGIAILEAYEEFDNGDVLFNSWHNIASLIKASKLFAPQHVNSHCFDVKNIEEPIYLIYFSKEEHEKYGSLLLDYLSAYVSFQLCHSSENLEYSKEKNLIVLTIRNPIQYRNWATPSQARAIGCSLIYSFDKKSTISPSSFRCFMANSNTHIFSNLQNEGKYFFNNNYYLFKDFYSLKIGEIVLSESFKYTEVLKTNLHNLKDNEYMVIYRDTIQKITLNETVCQTNYLK